MPAMFDHPDTSRLPQVWLPKLRRDHAGRYGESPTVNSNGSICSICEQMKGYPDRIQACTTTHFDGVIAVIDPERSWVATWQRTSAYD